MVRRVVMSALALSFCAFGTSAFADAGKPRVLGCYKEVTVPAQYSVTRHLEEKPRREYIKRRTGIIELVEYPAVYREEKKLIKNAYKVMREVPCPSGH